MPYIVTPRPKKSYLYLPDGWDDGWKAAKAASGSTPCWITTIGDSLLEDTLASNLMTKTWMPLVQAGLSGRGYGYYGDFWPMAWSLQNAGGAFPGTPPWVTSATGITFSQSMLVGYNFWTGIGATFPATFNTPYSCTALDIVWFDYTAGTFQYTVDGGSAVTVTPAATGFLKRLSLTGLANTTHAIALGNQNADNKMVLMGGAAYKGTTGIGYGWCSAIGASLLPLGSAFGLTADQMLLWQGKYASGTTGFGFPTQPHLAILAMGINDCGNGYGLDSFEHNYRRLCSALRRGQQNASILFLIHNHPDTLSSDVTSNPVGNPQNWPFYMDRMYKVAADFNCAVVNMHAKWGEYAFTNGFLPVNNCHALDAGQADIANTLLQVI